MADEFELIAMREMLTDYVREAPEARIVELARFAAATTPAYVVSADLCDQLDAELTAANHIYNHVLSRTNDRIVRANVRKHRDQIQQLQCRLAAGRTQARSASESP